MKKPATPNVDTAAGFGFATCAYVLWGFLPLYLKAGEHIPALEVVAHRVIWSVPVAGLVLIVLRRTGDLRAALSSPRTLGMAAVTAALISVNWAIYVWAVSADRALDAALGYYINPLFSVFLGAVFLGERLNRLKIAALALAACAVAVLTYTAGVFPWVGLALAVSFGLYALCKRALPVGPNQGFLLEVLILLGPALAYVIWLGDTGRFAPGAPDMWWLMGCGVVTAVPLIFYANGAKGLQLSTIAILQYIAPTMIMLCAVFAFGEPFGTARAIAFPMIWAALILYTVSIWRGRRALVAA